jgi:hypothetical protein
MVIINGYVPPKSLLPRSMPKPSEMKHKRAFQQCPAKPDAQFDTVRRNGRCGLPRRVLNV